VLALLLLLLSLVPLEVVEFPLPAVQGLLRFLIGLERVLQPFFGLARCPFPRLASPSRTRHVCVERKKKKKEVVEGYERKLLLLVSLLLLLLLLMLLLQGKRGCAYCVR